MDVDEALHGTPSLHCYPETISGLVMRSCELECRVKRWPKLQFMLTMGWTPVKLFNKLFCASPEHAVCAVSEYKIVAGSAALLTRCIAGMHRNAAV